MAFAGRTQYSAGTMRVHPARPSPRPHLPRAHGPAALIALLGAACSPAPQTWARAYEMGSLAEGIGGPKAMARPAEGEHEGDLVLENDRIRLAILGTRNSLGPHTSGGSLIDADLQRSDPRFSQGRGLDQLAETFPTVNLNVQTADADDGEVVILRDGSDGGPAHICTVGPEQSFITLLDALWGLQWPGPRPLFHMRTDYELAPGDAAVKMTTTAIFGGAPSCEDEIDPTPAAASDDTLPLITLALQNGEDAAGVKGGLVFGDFYLQGGSVDVFTPDVGFDEGTFVQEELSSGRNTFTDPIVVDFLAGNADRVSYALATAEGRLFVPMFTSSQTVAVGAGVEGDGTASRFAAGSGPYSYERWFGVGRGDVGSAIEAVWEAQGKALGRVEGAVVEHGTGAPLSDLRVLAYRALDGGGFGDAPYLEWRTDVGEDPQIDGSFGGGLPPGSYELQVHGEGRPVHRRVPVTIRAGETVRVVLEANRPGGVRFEVVDEAGLRVPAKVTFFAADGTESPRDPVKGDGYIAGDPAHVVFTSDGTGQVILPPGRFRAVASRGIEYELGESRVFTVDVDRYADLQLQVSRSVDTAGWISADFHVHGARSHDSGVGLSERVTTMAAEGVEFLSSTDHDAITDYRPAIERLQLEPWVSATVGLEVTTIEVGHFLGFPVQVDNLADQGGALDWTDLTPQEMIDGIKQLGAPNTEEPIVFVGHPRDGILGYFDQFGVNTYQTTAGGLAVEGTLLATLSNNALLGALNFTLDGVDAMEVLNAKRFELIRTPTAPELALAADGGIDIRDILARTSEEQLDLEAGTYTLGAGWEGVLDDWFTLNNLGIRVTALGNSDTHGTTEIESGCPRNFVMSETDDPAFLDDQAIVRAVREGRVVASFGPFVRFWIGDESQGPGSDVSVSGPVELHVEVQSPSWFSVDRVELYENGSLIHEWTGDALTGDAIVDLATTHTVEPTKDSWYVVVAMGSDDLAPVFTPVEFPPIQLEDVVTGALSGIGLSGILSEPVPVPRAFPIYPYALTNPIWVDVDGDGEFTPPGLPAWLVEPAG